LNSAQWRNFPAKWPSPGTIATEQSKAIIAFHLFFFACKFFSLALSLESVSGATDGI